MAEKRQRKKKKIENRQETEQEREVWLTGRKKAYALSAAVFVFVILLICVGNLIQRDKKFSEQENRALTQKPKVSAENIFSGQFMDQYEEYKSDQFVGRNFWVQLKTTVDSVSGKVEENGVFNGKDDYLLEDITVPDQAELSDTLDAMKSFKERHEDMNVHVMLVPNAANILKDKLPALAVTADQSALLKSVHTELGEEFDWIDTQKTMKAHREEDIYYKTDSRWTSLGAYYAFQDAAESLGIAADSLTEMKAYGVSNTFNGTLSAASGYQNGYKEPVYIYLPEAEDAAKPVVSYVEEKEKTASLYASARLSERDQYAVFLDGDHALVDIRTTSENREKLLVIKDSYANCFVPFLVPYYREIVVVDPGYYEGDIDELVSDYGVTNTLFLYNANTFFEDRMLAGVLAVPEQTAEKEK